MRTNNWDKVRKQSLLAHSKRGHVPARASGACKMVEPGTNVVCPNGDTGRVVDHKSGLNVVIDMSGKVIGHMATKDLKIISRK